MTARRRTTASSSSSRKAEMDSDHCKRQVRKYLIEKPDKVLPLADTDEILSAGMQDDQIVVWAVRDEDKSVKRGRRIVCVNTGAAAPPVIRRCIGTVTSSADIVWHVLEVAGA